MTLGSNQKPQSLGLLTSFFVAKMSPSSFFCFLGFILLKYLSSKLSGTLTFLIFNLVFVAITKFCDTLRNGQPLTL